MAEKAEEKAPKLQEKDFDDETIDQLQKEIEDRQKGKSEYSFDPEGWRTMPVFMDNITEKDVLDNEQCAAMAALVHDNLTPEEIALQKKTVGNDNMSHALKADAINPANHARAAVRAYTDGLDQGCGNATLNAQLYCNRSMANFVIENFGRGLADAQRSILIDPTYVKAYNRGAKCASKIRKWSIAKNLIEAGLKLAKGESNEDKTAGGAPHVTDAAVVKDFEDLLAMVKKGEDDQIAVAKKEKLKTRSAAAKSNNLALEITRKGIQISPRAEVTSEQWAQFGKATPFFDQEGVLHIPILLMYDEAQTTDFIKDIPTDVTMAEVLEQQIMPFPWDTEGRYATLDQFVCVFLVDDGVAMPKWHPLQMDWTLFEVMRAKEYKMPGLVPTFHIVAKGSEILKQWGL